MVVVGAAKGSDDNDDEKDNQRLYDNDDDNDNENYLIPIARRDSAAQTHATLALYDTPLYSAGV